MNEFQILPNGRECGTCSMCCKLLDIPEWNKPRNVWCEHCTPGKGCNIYNDRPELCRTFRCIWLRTPEMPEWVKPSESKMLLCTLGYNQAGFVEAPNRTVITVLVDPAYQNVLREGTKQRAFLDELSYHNIIVCEDVTEFAIVDGVALPIDYPDEDYTGSDHRSVSPFEEAGQA